MRHDVRKRLADSIETAVGRAEGLVELEIVGSAKEQAEAEESAQEHATGAKGTRAASSQIVPGEAPEPGTVFTFSERFACPVHGPSLVELEPRIFSFNSPHGACDRCTGLGSQMEIDPDLVVPDPSLSIAEGALAPWAGSSSNYYEQVTEAIAERYGVDLEAPWEELPEDQRDLFLEGTNGEPVHVSYRNRYGRRRSYATRFEGIVKNLQRRYRETDSEWTREKIEEYMSLRACPVCGGARLRAESRAVLVGGTRIEDFCALSARRALERLRDLGNTVIVVEHDEQTMRASDHLVDLGPGAGEHGGRIVAQGTAAQVQRVKASLTGQFLAGTRTIELPSKRRKPNGYVEILGASQHNLRDIDVQIPLGVLTCVTGVSGSGKSTLVNEVLYKAVANRLHRARQRPGAHRAMHGLDELDKIIAVDQSPIGRTPRSNPATYTGLFDVIRDLFSKTQEARARGYKPGRFSFNVKGGRCEVCRGDGQIKIEMHFLPDVYVPCEQCHGKRYNRETLEVRFKGKSIADVLDMPVEEALVFFEHIPKCAAAWRRCTRSGSATCGSASPRRRSPAARLSA